MRILSVLGIAATLFLTGCATELVSTATVNKVNHDFAEETFDNIYKRHEMLNLIFDSYDYFDFVNKKKGGKSVYGLNVYKDPEAYFDFLRYKGYDLDAIFDVKPEELEKAIRDREQGIVDAYNRGELKDEAGDLREALQWF